MARLDGRGIMPASRISAIPWGPLDPLRRAPILASNTAHPTDDRRDDRAIVDAVLAGDREAYRVLVEREGASVVRACHRVLGDLHEAEDAAQEAFVIAYRSLASWRGDGPFGAWLTRIAVRIALRQAGKRRAVTWLDPTTVGDGPVGRSGVRGSGRGLDGGGRVHATHPTSSSAPSRPAMSDRRSPRCPSHIERS